MKKITISGLITPKVKISDQNLDIYFSNLTHESNNIINGYAWFQYLNDVDYKKYLKSECPSEIRDDIKVQIINNLSKL